MDGKDLDLIALSHALARFRAQGSLLDDQRPELSLSEIKTALLAGTPYADDADININIGSLETESNVTIVEQTIDCEEHSQTENIPVVVEEPAATQEHTEANNSPAPEQQEEKPQGFGGRLFQYFKGGKNE